MTGITGFGQFTQTNTMINHSMQQSENARFEDLLKSAKASAQQFAQQDVEKKVEQTQNSNLSNISSSQILARDTRLNGEFTSDFSKAYVSEKDKTARASGFAANSAKTQTKTIDKTSKLYEKSLELESFFVKMMVDSMRKTVAKSDKGENSFAQKMYEDMLYDEYTTALTKNAGFGIADSIYLELSRS